MVVPALLKKKNMKKIHFIMLIIAILIGLQTVNGQSEVPLSIQYCTEDINASMGVGNYSELSAALFLSEELLSPYKGKKMSSIAVGITHGSDEIFGFKVFITKVLGETPLYSQSVTDKTIKEGWNSIQLDVPFEITGEALYVGYDLESSGSPVGITSSSASNANGSWIKRQNKWQINTTKGSNCIKAIVEGCDLSIDRLIINSKLKAYSPVNVVGKIVNGGGSPITEFIVTYKLDNGNNVESKISTPIAIKAGLSYEFVHTEPLIMEEGSHVLKVNVSAVSPHTDEFMDNNVIESNAEAVFTDKYYKSILLEHFTTESCQNCPGGHAYLSNVIGDSKSVVWVAHHAGFGTDKYTVEASKEMAEFFRVNGAPMCMLDREKDGGSPVYENMTQVKKETFDERIAAFSIAQVQITGDYDKSSRTLTLEVLSTFLTDISGAKLSIYLIEEGVTTRNQAGSTGLYTHAPLLRQTLSATWGDDINAVALGTVSKEYSCVIPEAWNSDKLKVVAFINEHNSNRIKCKVHNVAQVALNDISRDVHYVSVSSKIEERGQAIELIGRGYYREGEVVGLMARPSTTSIPSQAPIFKGWSVDGEDVATSSAYSFVMGNKDVVCVAKFENPIGIVENAATNYRVYLTNNGELHVEGDDYIRLELYNMSGNLVVESSNSPIVDIPRLDRGVYIVRLINDHGIYTTKIAK